MTTTIEGLKETARAIRNADLAERDAEREKAHVEVRSQFEACLAVFKADCPPLAEFADSGHWLTLLRDDWQDGIWPAKYIVKMRANVPGHETVSITYRLDQGVWSRDRNSAEPWSAVASFQPNAESPHQPEVWHTACARTVGEILLVAEAGYASRLKAIEEGQEIAARKAAKKATPPAPLPSNDRLCEVLADWLVERGFALCDDEGITF